MARSFILSWPRRQHTHRSGPGQRRRRGARRGIASIAGAALAFGLSTTACADDKRYTASEPVQIANSDANGVGVILVQAAVGQGAVGPAIATEGSWVFTDWLYDNLGRPLQDSLGRRLAVYRWYPRWRTAAPAAPSKSLPAAIAPSKSIPAVSVVEPQPPAKLVFEAPLR
jgi:hypothetical protein